MVLEGIITTRDPAGQMHVAAMGPHVGDEAGRTGVIERLSLRPFATSQTAVNLSMMPEGVFHLVDDVLLFARVVTKTLTEAPASRTAVRVRGWVLEEACRAYEFTIDERDTSQERLRYEARVVMTHEGRPFVGFNRAKHAVVEAAIIVTRMHLLGAEAIRQQMLAIRPLVEKTGGRREREAWEVIERYVG